MTKARCSRGFDMCICDDDAWNIASGALRNRFAESGFTARLIVDVTPALRTLIRFAAFSRCVTPDLLCPKLERAFGEHGGAGR